MIFLDTSAVYALADSADPNHDQARAAFEAALAEGARLLLHNYVVLESVALLQARLGLEAAIRFTEACVHFEVVWVDRRLHDEAVAKLAEARRRHVSLVDQVSFLVMQARAVEDALAFDPDYEVAGFRLWRARS